MREACGWLGAAAIGVSVVVAGCAARRGAPGAGGAAGEPAGAAQAAGRERGAPAGPTSDAGFRDPFGFQGSSIFAPLEWPDADEVRTATGEPGPAYWQQQVDYRIDAELLGAERAVRASAVVTYHNNSPHELEYLWLHLEQNLFREHSIGALSKEPGSRFGYREGFQGGFEIERLRAAGEDLPLAVYDTMGRVDLPEPIGPGETFEFEMAWSFNIPPFGADRLAMEDVEQGTIFEIAQWFPAVAVYDDVDGWNTMGYLGQGEFYTNFGDFDVRITAPRSHVVVASGELRNASEVLTPEARERLERARAGEETVVVRSAAEVGDPASWPAGEGALTWRFTSRGMRTFAWASSAAFIWDAAGLEVPGCAFSEDDRVLVQAVYPKEATETWHEAVQMARHSIGFNSSKWHPFPYPVATNVNGEVGGMEYPGFVFCGGRRSREGLYGVTDHEFGHTWFPMMVNTDERRHAWMDEGFNTFINIYTKMEYLGGMSEGARGTAANVLENQLQGNQQPMMTFPDQIWRGRLGYLAYGKPAAALWQLREFVLGHERFDRAFREYIDRWAFKHPQPSDFFRTMEDVAGMDLAWFWRGWIYSTATLDQAVVNVEHAEDGSWVYVDLESRDEMVMPVRLEIEYDDGTVETRDLPVEIWATTNAWTAGWDPRGRRVERVTVDPAGILPDKDRANNEWTR